MVRLMARHLSVGHSLFRFADCTDRQMIDMRAHRQCARWRVSSVMYREARRAPPESWPFGVSPSQPPACSQPADICHVYQPRDMDAASLHEYSWAQAVYNLPMCTSCSLRMMLSAASTMARNKGSTTSTAAACTASSGRLHRSGDLVLRHFCNVTGNNQRSAWQLKVCSSLSLD